ncbi:Gapdh [Symbiodinium natans]|uniref:Gapdh protein n=1 Tax=Symbiodinium natans TaxID=878477 RepID=A0A812I9C5_9DINO|nr:Gapdh [Symbiodinium natans]
MFGPELLDAAMFAARLRVFCCCVLLHCYSCGEAKSENAKNVDIRSWEPAETQYWLHDARSFQALDKMGAFPILNFTRDSLRPETFDRLVQEGRPFVVRGLGKAHPMKNWDCDFFRHQDLFRNVQGRREYADTASQQPQWMPLHNIMSSSMVDLPEAKKTGAGTSPYYVGIKDVQYRSPHELSLDSHYSPTWTRELLEFVQNHTVVPEFMRGNNMRSLRDTPEFWFVQGGGESTGAKAHVDVHPESTWSLQLCGEKRWRVAAISPRAAPHVMKLYQDGQIYNRSEHRSWNLFEDAVLFPGDALFFGPAFIHQTLSEGVGPAASITWQFDDPMPANFMRAFMPRLRFTADCHALWPRMQHLVQWAQRTDMQKIQQSSDLCVFLDMDGDGSVTESERTAVVSLWKALISEVKAKVPRILRQRMQLGLEAVVEDQHELADLPKKLRDAVQQWEIMALQLDAAVESDFSARGEL